MADPYRGLRAVFYLTMGIVAAFAVSAVAGLWDGGSGGGAGLLAPGGPEGATPVRVEVLNGAGAEGIAREATGRLRAAGFDVVFFGNAARFGHSRSVVLDRVGKPEPARAVAAVLGIDSVATALDASLMLEATVVLGEDWPPPEPEPAAGWWDRIRGGPDTLP